MDELFSEVPIKIEKDPLEVSLEDIKCEGEINEEMGSITSEMHIKEEIKEEQEPITTSREGSLSEVNDNINPIYTEEINSTHQTDPNESRTCSYCYKMFFDSYTMIKHVKTQHSGMGRYKCDKCDKSFASNTSLKYHAARHHSEGTVLKCEKCDECYKDFQSYKEHMVIHGSISNKEKLKCDECDKIIIGKRNLRRHQVEIHNLDTKINLMKTTVKSYYEQCDECDYVAKRKNDLKRHKENKHSLGIDAIYPCDKCYKTFKYKQSRKLHQKEKHENSTCDSNKLFHQIQLPVKPELSDDCT